MKFNWLLATAVLAIGLAGCESDKAISTPVGCASDSACDDGVPCTLDRCDPLTKRCVHSPKTCEDGDACTVDTCAADTGECQHAALTCDDLDKCTTDTCEPAVGCVFTHVACLGRGDLCSVPTCIPETGACADLPKDCEDNNACTADACEATSGNCTHSPVDDGSPCSVGANYADVSQCRAGACVPDSALAPGVFRIATITLVSPDVTFDLGNGPEGVNDAISTFLTGELDQFKGGGLVAVLDPLHFGETGSSLRFGEGDCRMNGTTTVWCGLLAGGKNAVFEYVSQKSTGECSTTPAVPAPCFQTPEVPFDLSQILPDYFPNPTSPVQGQAFGGLPGDPVSGISNGFLAGFVPKTIVDGLSADLAGRTVTGAELLANVATITQGGVEGYEVLVAFTAIRTALKPSN